MIDMGWVENILVRLEAQLRLLIEGEASTDGFPPRLHHQLVQELIEAMKAAAHQQLGEAFPATRQLVAPEEYTFVLPTQAAQLLLSDPSEMDRLTRILQNAANRIGIVFSAIPMLHVVADPKSEDIHVRTQYSQSENSDSNTHHLEELTNGSITSSGDKLLNAFLIVNGLSTYFIRELVVNIGRSPANQLQIDEPQISAIHAQLRQVNGRFVIFDLDSRGGTFVNGVAVSSHGLNSGDVIQLARIPLVFGQEAGPLAEQTQELPIEPAPPEVL
jgi:hypothetical protein